MPPRQIKGGSYRALVIGKSIETRFSVLEFSSEITKDSMTVICKQGGNYMKRQWQGST